MEKNFMGEQTNADLAHLQNMGDNTADLARLQSMSEETSAELAHLQNGNPDVENLSDEEFLDYINKIADGEEIQREEVKEAHDTQPFKTFATSEDYQKDFDERFNRRFRGLKQNEAQLEKIKAMAHDVYGDVDDDALMERIQNELLSAAASKQGTTPENYQKDLELKSKAEKYDALMQEENERQEIMNSWIADAEKLKAHNPDFDLEKALQNPEFRKNLVENGMSVMEAAYAGAVAGKRQMPQRSIMQNAASPATNPTVRKDPSQMSDAEFRKYISGIEESI